MTEERHGSFLLKIDPEIAECIVSECEKSKLKFVRDADKDLKSLLAACKQHYDEEIKRSQEALDAYMNESGILPEVRAACQQIAIQRKNNLKGNQEQLERIFMDNEYEIRDKLISGFYRVRYYGGLK